MDSHPLFQNPSTDFIANHITFPPFTPSLFIIHYSSTKPLLSFSSRFTTHAFRPHNYVKSMQCRFSTIFQRFNIVFLYQLHTQITLTGTHHRMQQIRARNMPYTGVANHTGDPG